MINNLAKLASVVSLPDELAKPTELKTPAISDLLETANAISEEMEQFNEPTPEPVQHFETEPRVIPIREIQEEEEEPYDAEKEARSLVHTMHAIDQFVLNIAVMVKCRSAAGGSKGLEKMKTALTKEFSGEELTDNDRRLIARFKEYKSNMELLSGEMIIKPDELNRLIEVATDYCEESKIKVGTGTAFWTNYLGSLAGRVTKIVVK